MSPPLQAVFTRFDEDGSGTMNIHEMRLALEAAGEGGAAAMGGGGVMPGPRAVVGGGGRGLTAPPPRFPPEPGAE